MFFNKKFEMHAFNETNNISMWLCDPCGVRNTGRGMPWVGHKTSESCLGSWLCLLQPAQCGLELTGATCGLVIERPAGGDSRVPQ